MPEEPAGTGGSRDALSDLLMGRMARTEEAKPEATEPESGAAENGREAPVSFGQQRLWLLDRLDPGRPIYNMTFRLRFSGPLDRDVLGRALSELRCRHESLRTTFAVTVGEPKQIIAPPGPQELVVMDLSELGEAAEAALEESSNELAEKPFDLEKGPLFRTTLLDCGNERADLVVSLHHTVFDGWSFEIFQKELAQLYKAFAAGEPSPLPALNLQYGDHAQRQREELSGERLEEHLAFWRKEIGIDPDPLELPTDRPRPSQASYRGDSVISAFPKELLDQVRAVAGRANTSPFFTLMGLFQALLGRWSGVDRIATGTAVANREQRDLHGMIGFFVNTVVLTTDLVGRPSLIEVLSRLRRTAAGVFQHQELPFERLVDELTTERDLSRGPLFQVVFTMQDGAPVLDFGEGLRAEVGELASSTAKFDLMLVLEEHDDSALCEIEFAVDLFDRTTMQRLGSQMVNLCRAALADPARPLATLPLLSVAETHQVGVEWNDTFAPYSGSITIHEAVLKVAEQQPDAIAVVCGDEHLSYRELVARSTELASRLIRLGVGPEELVATAIPRSTGLIVSVLGILQSGGGYLPLDVQYPADRLIYMMQDAGARVLVTEESELGEGGLPEEVVAGAEHVVLLSEREDPDPVPPDLGWGRSLAYANYTSGSTGKPKAVGVGHAAVLRLIEQPDYVRLGPGESMIQLAPASFDAATFEIWGALYSGSKLLVAPPGPLSLGELGEVLIRHQVSCSFITSGLFHQMVVERVEGLASLRWLLTGGDVVPVSDVDRFVNAPGATGELIHCYGPTENTTFSTTDRILPGTELPSTSLPIGRPIERSRAFVIDELGQALPIGVAGELAVGGDGLARGYLGKPVLTADRFTPDGISGQFGRRLYRTGDRARMLRDGQIEFLGRIDNQVKLRGFRIEPQEIESHLTEHETVESALVMLREDRPGDRRLVAYLVPSDAEVEPPLGELRGNLESRLPAFMVPQAFVLVEELPLNANGKVDRKALPAPSAAQDSVDYVAPRTELERQVAQIWSDALGVERVGVHDSFWALGGHSLVATRVIARIQEEFGIDIPLATLFEAARLVTFTEAIGAAMLEADDWDDDDDWDEEEDE